MGSVLERQLLVITGKGGVGKTTIAAAIGLLAAQRGLSAIVVEVGDQSRLPGLFGLSAQQPGGETRLQEGLSSISIDPDRALLEWLQALGGRVPGRVLASSGTFQYFAAAAPGAKELVTMVKIWELTEARRWHKRAAGYDLVVVDAPASGHALGMLRSPHTFGAIARVGPIAGQARKLRELLEDPARAAYLAVALGTEMAITEALELQEDLRRQLGQSLATVILNGLLPQRFTGAELARIGALERDTIPADAEPGKRTATATTAAADELRGSAVRAARAIHDRARQQRNQLARLRRRSFTVVGVPFVWDAELELPAVRAIAERLARKL